MQVETSQKPKSLIELTISVEPKEYEQYLKTAASKNVT